MASAFTIRLEGADELIRQIGLLELRVRSDVAALITRYAKLIAVDAKRRAPRDTGRGIKSIKAELERVLTDLAAEVHVHAFWMRFIEKGTSRLTARPFLIPAFEAHAPAFLRELRQILNRP